MSFKLRIFTVVVAVLIAAGGRAGAQGYFGLGVTGSASSILVSNSLTYTITVTNVVGTLADVIVSNTLPATVQYVSATPGLGVSVTNYGSIVVFDISSFIANDVLQMSLTVRPTATGLITNTVFVSAPFNTIVTNTATTIVVTQVTNTIPPTADLGVAITVPTTAVIVNDLMKYSVSVTNGGPDAASNVMLTNVLPAGVILKAGSSNTVFNLGLLTNGAVTNLQFTIQPTNVSVLNFFASVGASSVTDTNTANNTASNSLAVIDYFPGQLVATIVSTQIYNSQNGLIEQTIKLSNVGTNAVTAARVIVTGLSNRLFNAVGTNNSDPFVVYASGLETNQSVNLLLQFFALDYFPFTDSQLQAFAVPVPDLTPPVALSYSTNLNITRIVKLANGNMLIEFPSLTNRVYTVVYSDNVSFSNATIAPPSIVASANKKQWVDYGPPTTLSPPTNSSARFYRVILNP